MKESNEDKNFIKKIKNLAEDHNINIKYSGTGGIWIAENLETGEKASGRGLIKSWANLQDTDEKEIKEKIEEKK